MKGKVILITGGTSGIGRATARMFAEAGAAVAFTGRREKEGEEVQAELRALGADALYLKRDVSQEDDCRSMVDETLSKFGKLHYAFNNAGVEGRMGALVEETPENFRQVFDINVLGVLMSMKYQVPAIRNSGGGAIVNNSSIAGTIAMPGVGTYVASKHAVIGLTKTAALEYSKEGVRVNAVSPAAIETDMFERFAGSPDNREYIRNLHPIGRLGRSAEIAQAVFFLCSENASFITGTNLLVDGGFTAQ